MVREWMSGGRRKKDGRGRRLCGRIKKCGKEIEIWLGKRGERGYKKEKGWKREKEGMEKGC